MDDHYPEDPIEVREFVAAHGHDDRDDQLERDIGEHPLPRGVRRPAALLEIDSCLCGVSSPDYFGNRDLLEHDDCPLHGKAA